MSYAKLKQWRALLHCSLLIKNEASNSQFTIIDLIWFAFKYMYIDLLITSVKCNGMFWNRTIVILTEYGKFVFFHLKVFTLQLFLRNNAWSRNHHGYLWFTRAGQDHLPPGDARIASPWFSLRHQWRIYGGGGGGLGGLNPPPLGLPSKNLMCIEKRHHNMSRPTLCSYSTLSQAQPQTVGFNPPPPPWAAKWTCDVIMDCFLWSPLR